MADTVELERMRIDLTEHVKVDETVVKRCDQGIGHRMSKPHQVGVVSRRIDNDEIAIALHRAHRSGESLEFLCLDLIEPRPSSARDPTMLGMSALYARPLH